MKGEVLTVEFCTLPETNKNRPLKIAMVGSDDEFHFLLCICLVYFQGICQFQGVYTPWKTKMEPPKWRFSSDHVPDFNWVIFR